MMAKNKKSLSKNQSFGQIENLVRNQHFTQGQKSKYWKF